VSIEHEGTDGDLTEEQFAASVWLHKYIAAEVKRIHGQALPLDEQHVIGHFQVDPVRKPNCPGPKFPWARLYQSLREEGSSIMEKTAEASAESVTDPADPRIKELEAHCEELSGRLQALNAQLLAVQNSTKASSVPDWAQEAFSYYSTFIHEPSGTTEFWRLLTIMYRAQTANAKMNYPAAAATHPEGGPA